ncbi:MAG: hypothetical protein U0165_18030 [Polyangiaceae bacterium]
MPSRTFDHGANQARIDASVGTVRACLDLLEGSLPEGRQYDAIDLAEEIGHFRVRLVSSPSEYTVERVSNGRMLLNIPLSLGHAEVTLENAEGASLQSEAVLALLFVLVVASWLGAAHWRSSQ